MNLFRTPFFLPKFYPSLLWRVATDRKEIFLTFDDGPVPGPTEFVLEQLKLQDAKATFFCIGDNVKKYPEILKKIGENGHAIGNHTFNHLKGWSTSTPHYLANIENCKSQIENHNFQSNNLFRPPYGRITSSQIKALKNEYQIVMWDVLTHDYSKGISGANCFQGAIKATRPGSIIVFHDSLKAEKNLRFVLPKFLEHFTSQGFVFKTLLDI